MTVPVSNIYVRFSNTAVTYTGFGMNVANINCNADASIMKLNVNGNPVFRVDMDGNFGYQREIIWIPAKAMIPSLTNGAYYNYYETSTSKIVQNTLIFSSTEDQSVQFDILMPKSWNKDQIKYRIVDSAYVSSGSLVQNTVWKLEAVAISDQDPILDPVMVTRTYLTSYGSDDTKLKISDESPYTTIDGSIQDNDWVTFKLTREASNVGDNMTVQSSLYGIQIILNPNNNN